MANLEQQIMDLNKRALMLYNNGCNSLHSPINRNFAWSCLNQLEGAAGALRLIPAHEQTAAYFIDLADALRGMIEQKEWNDANT